MIFVRSNGLRLSGSNLPVPAGGGSVVPKGDTEVVVAEPLSTNKGNGSIGGKFSVAIGLSEILSQWNLPNPVDYFKGIWGSFNDREDLANKFNSQFRTLGNGQFDINDVLAFPVNWGIWLQDHVKWIPKMTGKTGDYQKKKNKKDLENTNNPEPKPNSGNSNNNNNPNGGTGYAR